MTDKADNESSVFGKAMLDVNRTHKRYKNNKVQHPTSRSETIPCRQDRNFLLTRSENTHYLVDDTEQGNFVSFARSGVQKKILRSLKRGEFPFDTVLDLHGFKSHEVKQELENFLSLAISQNQTCILIIHGKGYRSENQKSVLKPLTINWLKHIAEVKAFSSALPKHGGTGAVYVLLKSR